MAHGTLVTDTSDVRFLSDAQRPITKNAGVALIASGLWHCGNSFIERDETMARVGVLDGVYAGGAAIPIRAIDAFMTNSINILTRSASKMSQ